MKKLFISFWLVITLMLPTFLCLNVYADSTGGSDHGGSGGSLGDSGGGTGGSLNGPYLIRSVQFDNGAGSKEYIEATFSEIPSFGASTECSLSIDTSHSTTQTIYLYDNKEKVWKISTVKTGALYNQFYFWKVANAGNIPQIEYLNFTPNGNDGGFDYSKYKDKTIAPLLEVVSFEYMPNDMTGGSSAKADGCYDNIRIKIKNNSTQNLKVDFSADTQDFSSSPNIKIASSEHLSSCFYKFKGTGYSNSTLLYPKKTNTVVLTCLILNLNKYHLI